MRLLLGLVLLIALAVYGAFRPVCVPLSDNGQPPSVPYEQRTDRDFYLQVFQKRDGQWCQCKTWISRQFFF